MLFVLSPAKALNDDTPAAAELMPTAPLFVSESAELVDVLRPLSPQQLAHLMGISDKLAALNVARYAVWSRTAGAHNACAAVLAFDGDVYDGLQARRMSAAQLQWLQAHLCILSGLYGVLRPLDWMQPYRLEMGTALANRRGANLYAFWRQHITGYLRRRLQEQGEHGGAPVLVNLASQEYFKAVDVAALHARVVECVFQDYKNGAYKTISLYAKRARGLMMRYCAEHDVQTVPQLQGFCANAYRYAADASSADRLVFRRRVAE